MSTNAVVGYNDSEGNFRGTSVHFDGDLAGEQLNEMFGGDRQALIEWVEKGIAESGYRNLDETYNDEGEVLFNLQDAKKFLGGSKYLWIVLGNGIVASHS